MEGDLPQEENWPREATRSPACTSTALTDEASEEVAPAADVAGAGSAVEELELEHEGNASRNQRNRLAAEAAIRLAEAAIGSATSATGSAGLHPEWEDDADPLAA